MVEWRRDIHMHPELGFEEHRTAAKVAAMMSGMGYRVRAAGNGLAALDLLAEASVDLVLTDVVMPEMGGRELYRRCREVAPDAAFLFSSGYPSDALSRNGSDDVEFVSKPYTIGKLAVRIREVLAAHRRDGGKEKQGDES